MKKILLAIALTGIMFAGTAQAMEEMDHSKHKDMATESTEHSMETMKHGSSQEMNGNFKHMVMVDGIHAEFQVMNLASMNMTDPAGNTHHVMATFSHGDTKITEAVGKVKIISPSGKEQLADLKNFGGGNYAANFTIDEDGKWGIICLFKDAEGKHTAKFYYPHMTM